MNDRNGCSVTHGALLMSEPNRRSDGLNLAAPEAESQRCAQCGGDYADACFDDDCAACSELAKARLVLSEHLDAEERLAVDLYCQACHYNLRNLALTARCPECNATVIDTVEILDLRFSRPDWLERLAGGLRLLTGVPLWVGWIVVTQWWLTQYGSAVRESIAVYLSWLVGAGLMLLGLWDVASPERPFARDRANQESADALRFLVILNGGLAVFVTFMLVVTAPSRVTVATTVPFYYLGTALFFAALLNMATPVILTRYLCALASRVASVPLRKQSRRLYRFATLIRNLLCLSFLLTIVYALLPSWGDTRNTLLVLLTIPYWIVAFAVPVFLLWLSLLTSQFRVELKRCAEEARSIRAARATREGYIELPPLTEEIHNEHS